MNWEIQVPRKVVFGAGKALEAVPEILVMGSRIALVVGSDPVRARWMSQALEDLGAQVLTISCPGEPTLELLRAHRSSVRDFRSQVVVGLGGGSALDLAKALAALASTSDDPLEFLEVVGKGRTLPATGLPCVAIPTTSGTGSEATRNAVVSASGVKASLRGPAMMPVLSIVDPTLALSLSRSHTANTGLDALTQLVEPFVSRYHLPFSDALCREAIPRAVQALPRVLANGADLQARTDLAQASLFSGMALANAKLGAVHGLAAPLGGRLEAPHGELCARLLVPVWKANCRLAQNHPAVRERFRLASVLLAGDPQADLTDGQAVLERLVSLANPRNLSHWGFSSREIPVLREAGQRASSMKGNPLDLPDVVVEAILEECL